MLDSLSVPWSTCSRAANQRVCAIGPVRNWPVLAFEMLHDVGIPVYGLVTGAGVGGIAVALAAKSTLENFMSALNLFADRPVRAGDLLRTMKVVKEAGTGFAFPSRTLYLGRDGGLDDEKQQAAKKQVREWGSAQTLPFPDFTEDYRARIADTLDYPPEGPPEGDRGQSRDALSNTCMA